jgi:drug/metabolite transporter (DMT)-like permease
MTGLFLRISPLLFVTLWSSAFIAIRLGLPDISPLLFLSARFTIAAVASLAIVLAASQRSPTLGSEWGHVAVAGILINALYLSGVYLALRQLPAATMALIGALHPLLTAIAACVFLREALTPVQGIGFLLGILGVGMTVGLDAAQIHSMKSALLGLGGVIALSFGTIYFRRYCRNVPLLLANPVQLAAAALACWLMTATLEDAHAAWTATTIGTLLYLGLLVSVGAQLLFMFMLQQNTAGRVSANFYLTPGLTALLAWPILGERPSGVGSIGFAVATLGIWLVNRDQPASRK